VLTDVVPLLTVTVTLTEYGGAAPVPGAADVAIQSHCAFPELGAGEGAAPFSVQVYERSAPLESDALHAMSTGAPTEATEGDAESAVITGAGVEDVPVMSTATTLDAGPIASPPTILFLCRKR
jgi:hypothetical protein